MFFAVLVHKHQLMQIARHPPDGRRIRYLAPAQFSPRLKKVDCNRSFFIYIIYTDFYFFQADSKKKEDFCTFVQKNPPLRQRGAGRVQQECFCSRGFAEGVRRTQKGQTPDPQHERVTNTHCCIWEECVFLHYGCSRSDPALKAFRSDRLKKQHWLCCCGGTGQ